MIAKRKTTAKQTWRLAVLLLTAFTWTAESGNNESDNAAAENGTTPTIRVVDQYGRQVPSGKRYAGSEIFDVIVGPVGNELTFAPDTVNVRVGDTVRWTWESNNHSVLQSSVIQPATRRLYQAALLVGNAFRRGRSFQGLGAGARASNDKGNY